MRVHAQYTANPAGHHPGHQTPERVVVIAMPGSKMRTTRPGMATGPNDAQAGLAGSSEVYARCVGVQHTHRTIDDDRADWQRIERRSPDVDRLRIERQSRLKLQRTPEMRQQDFESSSLEFREGTGRGIPMKPDGVPSPRSIIPPSM